MATKNIVIKAPATKGQKRGTTPSIITDPKKIKEALADYTQINTPRIRELLITGKTYIRYINKEDKGLRLGGFLRQITEDYVTLSSGKSVWTIKFEKNKIYAKLTKMYENMEKADAYDFINELVDKKTIKLQVKKSGKWTDITWENVLQLYYRNADE